MWERFSGFRCGKTTIFLLLLCLEVFRHVFLPLSYFSYSYRVLEIESTFSRDENAPFSGEISSPKKAWASKRRNTRRMDEPCLRDAIRASINASTTAKASFLFVD